MKNQQARIIYIGKAKNLRKRVTSYFSRDSQEIKTRILLQNIFHVDIIETATEQDALLLENTLIKQWSPQFNIDLKDGKSFPVLKLTKDPFPYLIKTRRKTTDGSQYFGPFPNTGQLAIYLKVIDKLFPLRKCRGKLPRRESPCLYYHIGRCRAPCVGKITRDEYAELVTFVIKLLNGQNEELSGELKRKMAQAAARYEFEKASSLRDQLLAIEELQAVQLKRDDPELEFFVAEEKAEYTSPLVEQALVKLQSILKLDTLPRHIEGFDIAHLAGQDTVASMVCFINGLPEKKAYRIFKIKSLEGKIDDFESIREAVARRYMRVLNENQKKPDLILIDGGSGQVNAAGTVLDSLGLNDIAVCGLAKKNEELYPRHTDGPLRLAEGDQALRILQYVRDEAHRFATGFHKNLRTKRVNTSLLESIKGIGPQKSRLLLLTFGSVKALSEAGPEKIAHTAGISRQRAEELIARLRP